MPGELMEENGSICLGAMSTEATSASFPARRTRPTSGSADSFEVERADRPMSSDSGSTGTPSVTDGERRSEARSSPQDIVVDFDVGFKVDFEVDFVLAFVPPGDDVDRPDEDTRDKFHDNLRRKGFQVAIDNRYSRVHFVAIGVPEQLLQQNCELMRMQMPTKKLAFQTNFLTWEYSILRKLVRWFDFVNVDRTIFPPTEHRLLHTFSRDKLYLFDVHEPNFFSPCVRLAVVHFMLERAYLDEDDKVPVGVGRMVEDELDAYPLDDGCAADKQSSQRGRLLQAWASFSKLFEQQFELATVRVGMGRMVENKLNLDAYPLHDGCAADNQSCQRARLLQEWASCSKWFKYQPLDYIKEYFGVKIAMYFAWLGFYTCWLIPASMVGLVCFIYGLSTYRDNRISQEICSDNSTIMCPQCQEYCDYWYLNTTCIISKLAHIFDNEMTIVFSIFMSFWATLYLKMWKRYLSKIQHRWGVTEYCSLAEPPRRQYLARLTRLTNNKKTMFNHVTGLQEPSPPFWTEKIPSFICSYYVMFICIALIFQATIGIVVYRMSLETLRNIYGDGGSGLDMFTFDATTAAINLLVSKVLSFAYKGFAVFATNCEYRRTQTEYIESLNLKIYLFAFVNYYSSIFYIAFIKCNSSFYPAKCNCIMPIRQEECSPGGRLIELCIQLAIIMGGKQAIELIGGILKPFLKQKLKEYMDGQSIEAEGSAAGWKQWTKDFKLINWNDRSLFEEYLKLVIQYGFITIFVVAFPLGPLLALLNNIFETRLDATKFLLYYKRAVPQRARDIGIWYNIMHVVGKVAVITNAFMIAFSSKFIPRLVYMYDVNPTGTDEGFVNHTLAYFNITHFEQHVAPLKSQFSNVSICRYSDYRNPPDDARPYGRPSIYWQILAIRLAFVIIYVILVSSVQTVVAWAIPDVPGRLQEQIKREQYLTNEYIIEQEKLKMQRTSTVIVPNAHGSECVAGNGHIPSEDGSLPEEKMMHNATAVEDGGCVLRTETMPSSSV